jgi:predicted polyphosphate/ATP-dependent NAD kinase
MKIGLLVNPMYNKALELGAEPITPVRIKEVLKLINRQNIEFLVSPGNMGEDYIKDFNFDYKIIGKINKKQLMKIQKT